MKKTAILGMFIVAFCLTAVGCGEKPDTDTTKVNEGKGQVETVTPRNRDGEGGGGR